MTIKTAFIALPLLFLGWVSTLIMVGLVTDEAPASVVLFPSTAFVDNLPEDVAVLEWGNMSVTLVAQQPNVARRLYQSGAWIVLPAGLRGCLPLPASLVNKGRAPA